MRKALIRNGIVENTIEAEDDFFHPDDGVTLVATDTAGIGWTYDGTNFIAPPPAPTPVPASVAIWQFKAVLSQDNYIDAANNYVVNSGNQALIALWQYGHDIPRAVQSVENMATALNITSEQMDQIFISASLVTL